MRNLFRIASVVLALGAGAADPARGAPDTGALSPEPVMAVFPARFEHDEPADLLDPAPFEVRLTPRGDPDAELSHPAGSWFVPPPERWRIWIESDALMSPYSVLATGGGRGRETTAALPVVAAGRVVPPPGIEPASHLALRLLRAEVHRQGDLARWELSRQRPIRDVGAGLPMPAGHVVAALWDARRQVYKALSPPFFVPPGQTVTVPLAAPAAAAASLVAVLDRHETASRVDEYDVEWTLRLDAGDRPPDVVVPTADRVTAIWYDLPPGPAELRAGSAEHAFAPARIELRGGAVEHWSARLAPRPGLDVELRVPPPLLAEDLALELRGREGGDVLVRKALGGGDEGFLRFERLPFAPLVVELQTSLGAFTADVDLTSGADAYVLLEPELTVVTGTVYRGGEGHPAELEFHTVARTVEKVRTDEFGQYEVVLVKPLRGVSIALDGVEAMPWVEFFPRAVAGTRELDFRLPDAEYGVRVLDASTGLGIPEASVLARNVFPEAAAGDEEDPHEGDPGPTKAVNQQALTDEDGVAPLPPLREGSLEIRAFAEGYRDLPEPVVADVLDGETDQTFEVVLSPVGETVAVHLTLPSGAPAAGADVLLVDGTATGRSLFSARAGAGGTVAAPRRPAGVLLVRHPAAAFLVREWRPRHGEGEVEWRLPPAGRRLSIFISDGRGEQAVPRAELAIWVGGWRLSGTVLTWLTGDRAAADTLGYWTAPNVPQVPVAVLAWDLRERGQASTGSLDALATDVPYPWRDPVPVRAVR